MAEEKIPIRTFALLQGWAKNSACVRLGFSALKQDCWGGTGSLESLSFKLQTCEGQWFRDEAENELRVVLPYGVVIFAGAQDEKSTVALIQVVVRMTYRMADASIADDNFQAFASVMPFLHSWPYLRAEVQALTTRIGLPPLVLPVVVSGHARQLVKMSKVDASTISRWPPPSRRMRSKVSW